MPPAPDSGHTAWVLVSSALLLFMMIPGLALFYAGLVRAKNALSVLMHCIALTSVLTLLWFAFGYSLAFDTSGMSAGVTNLHSFVGSFAKSFLRGVGVDSMSNDAVIGLRVDADSETRGLDLSQHEEAAYNFQG